jgi:hypothetical protein
MKRFRVSMHYKAARNLACHLREAADCGHEVQMDFEVHAEDGAYVEHLLFVRADGRPLEEYPHPIEVGARELGTDEE